ncbi:HAD family hydrolase [Psychroflexus sp. MES1-P1E]|uniref:HAD family hydrolase n=1 Tax=Psychroflexus sp. MES1-P1E TaxID=2058320 RepID=UPI000C7B997F|nr:HAD hydrolase-like protein [Psychroflexus sp. MES1-P1E]PKG43430.1 haloacid dehalogenase [Psychroflexus sp. MES1-P1E]
MKTTNSIKTIFWDFDGVLMNSNAVRDKGFELVLEDYPKEQVKQLMDFHQANGGLSRYVKFRYFFEEIRGEKVTDKDIQKWADKFSEIMMNWLINKDLLIDQTINFVKENHQNYNMHIVSGSDGKELNQICQGIDIDQYFKSIHGSPTPKKQLVADLLEKYNYELNTCMLIGDSINDYDAAISNQIQFQAYGNDSLIKKSTIEFL